MTAEVTPERARFERLLDQWLRYTMLSPAPAALLDELRAAKAATQNAQKMPLTSPHGGE